ncbi:MAG: sodium:proton antiporter [Methylophilales bacterium 28-44-11]|nr:MAG: sodium:proton antiporter [Methylophilales bacterium 28-44-11]
MSNSLWFLLIGLLMLTRGLSTTTLKRLPITPAIIYLLLGFLLGPSVLDIFHFDPIKQSALLEVLTEIAVLISLFSAGVKMPVPISLKKWRPSIRLAFLSMLITVVLIAGFSYYVLNLPIGAGVLLGALLAPTDPVLATDAQSRFPGDKDQLRFTLTSEAGMNDGTAFPLVMLGLGLLGLHEIGEFGWKWLLIDVAWATLAAVLIGVAGGIMVGVSVWKLRRRQRKHDVLDDLVGLGLISIVYGLSLLLNAWGFLAVFFAAVALRHTELKLAQNIGVNPEQLGEGVEQPVKIDNDSPDPPSIVSTESLIFKEHLERLSELLLVLLVGGMLIFDFWNWRTLSLATFLFFLARPLSVLIGLIHTDTSWGIRGSIAWFGVRGIGSIYYLMYAIQHGVPEALARDLIQLTLIVIALSIVLHGISVKPILNWWGNKG